MSIRLDAMRKKERRVVWKWMLTHENIAQLRKVS